MIHKKSLLFIACISSLAISAAAKDEVSLADDLMPLFQRSCSSCHQKENGNQGAVNSGFLFDKKENVLLGVNKIIIPKKPEQSYLLMLITPPEDPNKKKRTMPPAKSKAPQMSKEEIEKITKWIKDGAKDN